MSRIEIQTLTPVHIGSGETIPYGSDFIKGKYKSHDFFGVVDARKVLDLIGERNVSSWVAQIDNRIPTNEIVAKFGPRDASLKDYSERLIDADGLKVKPKDTLKLTIHNGLGKPYIPGSSIKGAIRTAVLASLAKGRDYSWANLSSARIEGQLFGKDPNHDIFRFLQVGDALFGKQYTIGLRMVNINEREKAPYWDESKSQLIEAIVDGDESCFSLKLDIDRYKLAQNEVPSLPECMKTVEKLFETINLHTKDLLQSETKHWEEKKSQDGTGAVSDYLDALAEMLECVTDCTSGKECVLRVGHGSGWRFITGAWIENQDNFYRDIVPKCRPKNAIYEQYPFPKTRRVSDDVQLLGFVRLKLK